MKTHEFGDHISIWKSAFKDLLEALNKKHLWLSSSWRDIKLRYNNSLLGPLWITASMGVFIGCFSIIGAALFSIDVKEYLPFLTMGIITWVYISTILQEGADVFIAHSHLILNQRSPYSAWILRLFIRTFLIFLHNFLIFVAVVVFLKVKISAYTLLAIPGFLLLSITLLGLALVVSIYATKYRDIPPLLASIIQIGFFLTPVMWNPSIIENAGKRYIIDFNPLHHLISLVRNPLLNQPIEQISIIVSIIIALLSLMLGLYVFAKHRSKISYWL